MLAQSQPPHQAHLWHGCGRAPCPNMGKLSLADSVSWESELRRGSVGSWWWAWSWELMKWSWDEWPCRGMCEMRKPKLGHEKTKQAHRWQAACGPRGWTTLSFSFSHSSSCTRGLAPFYFLSLHSMKSLYLTKSVGCPLVFWVWPMWVPGPTLHPQCALA